MSYLGAQMRAGGTLAKALAAAWPPVGKRLPATTGHILPVALNGAPATAVASKHVDALLPSVDPIIGQKLTPGSSIVLLSALPHRDIGPELYVLTLRCATLRRTCSKALAVRWRMQQHCAELCQ